MRFSFTWAGEDIRFTYTNHRGETARRRVKPIELYHGSTAWHPEPQWLLRAWDLDKDNHRDFALAGIHPEEEG
jgi:predicted DNA-binding transcriptional regulator YafY